MSFFHVLSFSLVSRTTLSLFPLPPALSLGWGGGSPTTGTKRLQDRLPAVAGSLLLASWCLLVCLEETESEACKEGGCFLAISGGFPLSPPFLWRFLVFSREEQPGKPSVARLEIGSSVSGWSSYFGLCVWGGGWARCPIDVLLLRSWIPKTAGLLLGPPHQILQSFGAYCTIFLNVYF